MESKGIDALREAILVEFGKRRLCVDGYVADGLSHMVACMISERTPNLMVLAEALPRSIGLPEHRYQYISRHLARDALCVDAVMSGFLAELLTSASDTDGRVIVALDQSSLGDGRECLMLSVRMGNRALPLLWEVVNTQGAIGWEVQERLLTRFTSIMPLGQKILLSADRFYGTASLVQFCKDWGWQYRIRLKGNLIFMLAEGGTMTMNEAHAKRINACRHVTFNKTTIATHIGILHESGHSEPWFIAMDAEPKRDTILDYGKRWCIEAMFSDFKSRGFSITNSKLTNSKRMERLILVIALALIITTFVGIQHYHGYTQKNA
jgi:Transposase DDE domain